MDVLIFALVAIAGGALGFWVHSSLWAPRPQEGASMVLPYRAPRPQEGASMVLPYLLELIGAQYQNRLDHTNANNKLTAIQHSLSFAANTFKADEKPFDPKHPGNEVRLYTAARVMEAVEEAHKKWNAEHHQATERDVEKVLSRRGFAKKWNAKYHQAAERGLVKLRKGSTRA